MRFNSSINKKLVLSNKNLQTYNLDTIVTVVFALPIKIFPNKATAEPLQRMVVFEQIIWESDSMTDS